MIRFTPKIFTILKEGYSFANLKSDAFAGLTVAIVALPLAMALGIASGASPEQGIITSVIAGFIISFLGGSRVQIGGPTGAFVVIISSVISQHGFDGLLIATLLAGILLVLAGYARLGQLIKFIPQPVIFGFTSGIAVIIASTQLKSFFGLKSSPFSSDFIRHINAPALFVGVLALAAGCLAI
jgi:SulP family sulfate permease